MFNIYIYTYFLYVINYYSVFDIIQTRIEREKCHIEKIEHLKSKLCTKDNDINTLKDKYNLNKKQIDKYQVYLFYILHKNYW